MNTVIDIYPSSDYSSDESSSDYIYNDYHVISHTTNDTNNNHDNQNSLNNNNIYNDTYNNIYNDDFYQNNIDNLTISICNNTFTEDICDSLQKVYIDFGCKLCFNEKSIGRIFDCGHILCEECLTNSIGMMQSICPFCRTQITKKIYRECPTYSDNSTQT